MKRALKMAEYSRMSSEERDRALGDLVASSRRLPNGELAEVDQEIAQFEKQHRMGSDQMRAALRAGQIQETWDHCRWLMALNRRERLGQRAARAH